MSGRGRVGGMDADGDSEPAHQREAYPNAWKPFNPHEEEGVETRSEQGREEGHQEEEDRWLIWGMYSRHRGLQLDRT